MHLDQFEKHKPISMVRCCFLILLNSDLMLMQNFFNQMEVGAYIVPASIIS